MFSTALYRHDMGHHTHLEEIVEEVLPFKVILLLRKGWNLSRLYKLTTVSNMDTRSEN